VKKTHLSIALLSFIWGSTWLGIKVGLADMPPFLFAGLRFVLASAALLPFLPRGGVKNPDLSPLAVVITGVLIIPAPYALVYWGTQYVSSGLTSVLFSTMPIFVALLSGLIITGEKFSPASCVGLVLGFCGVLLIYLDDIALVGERASLGILAVLGSSVTSALGIVLLKRLCPAYEPIRLTLIHFLLGALLLIPLGLFTEDWREAHLTAASMLSLLYLSLVGSSLAFALYYWLLTKMDATRVSLLVYATPVVALFLGWLFLHESITLQVALGSALVIGGIKLAS
jgi:drug/metabolite transporter (DMT)-like permease